LMLTPLDNQLVYLVVKVNPFLVSPSL
jgi:hypothetical protein